jgi:hypothetical protein
MLKMQSEPLVALYTAECEFGLFPDAFLLSGAFFEFLDFCFIFAHY